MAHQNRSRIEAVDGAQLITDTARLRRGERVCLSEGAPGSFPELRGDEGRRPCCIRESVLPPAFLLSVRGAPRSVCAEAGFSIILVNEGQCGGKARGIQRDGGW